MLFNVSCSVLGNLPVYTVQSHLERLLHMSEHWCDVTGMSEQLAYELHQTIRGTYGMYLCNRFFIFVHFLFFFHLVVFHFQLVRFLRLVLCSGHYSFVLLF